MMFEITANMNQRVLMVSEVIRRIDKILEE